MKPEPRFLVGSDSSFCIEYGSVISPELVSAVRRLDQAIMAPKPAWVVETIPTYRSLLVVYDPDAISPYDALQALKTLEASASSLDMPCPTVTEIPVCYGGPHGPDLPYVAAHAGLTVEEVIDIHSGRDYLVYMIGFTIGFPYLGGMSPRIAVPRLATPRTQVPGGSVGIAGEQTGVYPVDSPGGWRIIGRTPIRFARPEQDPPCLVSQGDYLRFVPITQDEFEAIRGRIEAGDYRPKTYTAPNRPLEEREHGSA